MDWLKAILSVLAVIREFFSWRKTASDREAGRDSAIAETLGKNAEAVTQAHQAEVAAAASHTAMPGDEAFDQDFRRKD